MSKKSQRRTATPQATCEVRTTPGTLRRDALRQLVRCSTLQVHMTRQPAAVARVATPSSLDASRRPGSRARACRNQGGVKTADGPRGLGTARGGLVMSARQMYRFDGHRRNPIAVEFKRFRKDLLG